ncbi:hypothetical protein [Photobacterium atrarenae]|uniref:Uncharacterized protein n=1 Tax=Photobacterium atrarenae TaxID=865757 RepID=A0ABY5GR25_9GAMM|nr:hypothetical protein [Photobacterium atrarenae]UTV30987.1 hypothetical protein NNL38_24590 [Photobacterium atrarenae]
MEHPAYDGALSLRQESLLFEFVAVLLLMSGWKNDFLMFGTVMLYSKLFMFSFISGLAILSVSGYLFFIYIPEQHLLQQIYTTDVTDLVLADIRVLKVNLLYAEGTVVRFTFFGVILIIIGLVSKALELSLKHHDG